DARAEEWRKTGATEPCALAQTAAHEIGCSFGLGECHSCANWSSAMVEGNNGYNSMNGTYAPTSCDSGKVQQVAQYPTPTPTPTPTPDDVCAPGAKTECLDRNTGSNGFNCCSDHENCRCMYRRPSASAPLENG